MPLIDSYIKFDAIPGSYTTSTSATMLKHEINHTGWSEIYSLKYDLDGSVYPTLTITKPVDRASNSIYSLYLKNRARKLKPSNKSDPKVKEIIVHLCQWIDGQTQFWVFLEFIFTNCRVLDYSTKMDCDADDFPEETIEFGFREMSMGYYYIKRDEAEKRIGDDHSGIDWNFATMEGDTY